MLNQVVSKSLTRPDGPMPRPHTRTWLNSATCRSVAFRRICWRRARSLRCWRSATSTNDCLVRLHACLTISTTGGGGSRGRCTTRMSSTLCAGWGRTFRGSQNRVLGSSPKPPSLCGTPGSATKAYTGGRRFGVPTSPSCLSDDAPRTGWWCWGPESAIWNRACWRSFGRWRRVSGCVLRCQTPRAGPYSDPPQRPMASSRCAWVRRPVYPGRSLPSRSRTPLTRH